jgi:hypothetical protein
MDCRSCVGSLTTTGEPPEDSESAKKQNIKLNNWDFRLAVDRTDVGMPTNPQRRPALGLSRARFYR